MLGLAVLSAAAAYPGGGGRAGGYLLSGIGVKKAGLRGAPNNRGIAKCNGFCSGGCLLCKPWQWEAAAAVAVGVCSGFGAACLLGRRRSMGRGLRERLSMGFEEKSQQQLH